MVRVLAPPGCAGVSPAYSSVTHHGTEGIVPLAAPRERDAIAPWQTEESRGRSGMFLTCWNGARSRIAWVRGRLARRQQCAAFWARGHRALGRLTRAGRPPGCAGVSPADSSVTHHGSEGVLGARARCPGSPHEGGTPAWVRGRLARTQQCDPSRERGHRALGRLTRAERPPGCAGVSPADSSVDASRDMVRVLAPPGCAGVSPA